MLSGCGAVGSALPWGGRGRPFKSGHSDQETTQFIADCVVFHMRCGKCFDVLYTECAKRSGMKPDRFSRYWMRFDGSVEVSVAKLIIDVSCQERNGEFIIDEGAERVVIVGICPP